MGVELSELLKGVDDPSGFSEVGMLRNARVFRNARESYLKTNTKINVRQADFRKATKICPSNQMHCGLKPLLDGIHHRQ